MDERKMGQERRQLDDALRAAELEEWAAFVGKHVARERLPAPVMPPPAPPAPEAPRAREGF